MGGTECVRFPTDMRRQTVNFKPTSTGYAMFSVFPQFRPESASLALNLINNIHNVNRQRRNMQKIQLSSFQGDESSVDAQGFLLNASDSQSDLNKKERKEEEEVDDDERNKVHPAEQVVGYDLSPFTPSDEDMKYFFENAAAKEECCVKVDTNASWSREEKNQEESLLQKGGTKEQLARIEMYNTREVDSDSDDDDGDGEEEEEEEIEGGEDDIANEEEEMKEEGEKPAEGEVDYEGYVGLRNDDDDEEEEHDQEDDCLTNEQDGNGCLHNDKLSPMDTSNVDPSNVDIDSASGEKVELSHPQTDLDSTGTATEDRSSKPVFAAAVPLLKPPPKEKMEAYLKSKGWNKM
jgi:hypothetical protein